MGTNNNFNSKKAKELLKQKGELVLGQAGETAVGAYNAIVKGITEMTPVGGVLDITVTMEIKDNNIFRDDELCRVTIGMKIKLEEN